MVPSMISRLFGHLMNWLFSMFGWIFGRLAPPDCSSCSDPPGKELSESVRELYMPKEHMDMEVIFFHGLEFGDPRDIPCRRWMSADGLECWPQKWLPEKFPTARILAVSYDASVLKTRTRGRMDLKQIAENLVDQLILCNDVKAGQGLHCPLVLVGHSVGGLVIKQLCIHAFEKINTFTSPIGDGDNRKRLDTFLTNLRGVYYYSTPHIGLPVAKFVPWIKNRGCIMETIDIRNQNATILQSEFNAIRQKYKQQQKYKDPWSLAGVVESHETVLDQFCGVIVDGSSARAGNDFGNHLTVSENHFSVCRPKSRTAMVYKMLVTFLGSIKDQEKVVDLQCISSKKKFFVGLQSRVEKIQAALRTVPILGLHGMGGVGKTTLAREVYEKYYHEFDFSCWIPDLRELVQKESGQQLRHCMLEDLRYRGRKMYSEGKDWDILKGQRVLIIVDNVDADHLLEQIPLRGWFADGSRVIVTSRDKRFCQERFDMAMEVEFLSDSQSSELFLHHAFGTDQPPSHVVDYITEVLRICGGIPLAIEIIASSLSNEVDKEMWESVIQKLKDGEPVDGKKENRLLYTLWLSYDRFRAEEQKIFLDAALLFMDKPIVEALLIWKASWGPGVKRSWVNLISNCLVDVRDNNVWVHETLRMFAQNIACPKHDTKGMRNWLVVFRASEVTKLLTDGSQKSCKAGGLIYEPRYSNRPPLVLYRGISKSRFPHLRILIMTNVQIEGDAIHLSPALVYLKWSNAGQTTFPFVLRHLTKLCWLELIGCQRLKSIPEDMCCLARLNRLELEGCSSLMSLPTEVEKLTALIYLGVASSGLTEIPESIGNLANLETLVLRGSRISKLPESIGKLKKLEVIQAEKIPLTELPSSLPDCLSITRLDLSHTFLNRLPESFGTMRNLDSLDLSYTRLEKVPDSFTELGELSTLNLISTSIHCLPESFGAMKKLRSLYLSHTNLEKVPDSFTELGKLWDLDLSSTPIHCLPESFGAMKNLTGLDLSHTKLELLPNSITELGSLRWLHLRSTPLRQLPEHFGDLQNLYELVLSHTPLEELPDSTTKLGDLGELDMDDCKKLVCLPDGFENMSKLWRVSFIKGNQQAKLDNLPRDSLASLNIDYSPCVFSAHGSATYEIVQQATAQVTPSASPADHSEIGKGDARQLPPQEMRLGVSRGSCGLGEIVQSVRYPFQNLTSLTVAGNKNLAEFPRPLLHALPHTRRLEWLELHEFHTVYRLPEDFGDFLPHSLWRLSFENWRSLKELPESLGRVPGLQYLYLTHMDRLKGLPETLPDLPKLREIIIDSCESLRDWPSRGFGKATIGIWSWALMRGLVEKLGHLAPHVNFVLKREDEDAIEAELRAWGREHPASAPLSSFSFQSNIWDDLLKEYLRARGIRVSCRRHSFG